MTRNTGIDNGSFTFLDQDGEVLNGKEKRTATFGRSILFRACLEKDSVCEVWATVTLNGSTTEEPSECLLCRLIADSSGCIPTTTIWPQLGFEDLANDPQVISSEAESNAFLKVKKKWSGAKIELRCLLDQECKSTIPEETIKLTVEEPYRLRRDPHPPDETVVEKNLVWISPNPGDHISLDVFRFDGEGNRSESPIRDFRYGVAVQKILKSCGDVIDGETESHLLRLLLASPGKRIVYSTAGKSSGDQKYFREERIPAALRPVLYHSTHDGSLLNGFDVGDHDIVATLQGEAANDEIAGRRTREFRFFLVPHQSEWQIGDTIKPVEWGSAIYVQADLNESGCYTVPIARRQNVRPGAYDIIARCVSYGAASNSFNLQPQNHNVFVVGPSDIITVGAPGVVVRPRPGDNRTSGVKGVNQPAINIQRIAGRRMAGAPYFKFTDVIRNRDDLYGASLPTELTTVPEALEFFAVCSVDSKEALKRASTEKMAPLVVKDFPVIILKCQPQTGACGRFLFRPNAYPSGRGNDRFSIDIIARSVNRSDSEAPSHRNCQIDGFHVPGIRFVWDPASYTIRQIKTVGWHEYSRREEVRVQDDENFHDEGNGRLRPKFASVRGIVYFPATGRNRESNGPRSPADILGDGAKKFPLVIVVHGYSAPGLKSYLGYDYLLEHLARNGFAAASIFVPWGFNVIGRAHLINAHIQFLNHLFSNSLSGKIGLIGHSRGGSAVVAALRLNHEKSPFGFQDLRENPTSIQGNPISSPHDILAVASIAPVDRRTARSTQKAPRRDLRGQWKFQLRRQIATSQILPFW